MYKSNIRSVGTNDALQDSRNSPIDKIGERMDKLLDTLFEKIPDTTIVLSTLLIDTHEGVNRRIRKTINPQYQAIVKRRQDAKQRIVLADMYPAVNYKDLIDGTHPNDKGYRAMAKVWLEAIQLAGDSEMLVEPHTLPDEENQPQSTPTPTSEPGWMD